MHPNLVREFVKSNIVELQARLDLRPELGVAEIALDLDMLEVFISFDHIEHQALVVDAVTPLYLPGGRRRRRVERVPRLDVPSRARRLVLHMELDSYDLVPPTANLLDESRNPLPVNEWPKSFAGGGIVTSHPVYHRPFFCRRGLREYHTHFQHEDDPWANWRDGLSLQTTIIGLLVDLHSRWHYAA